MDEADDLLINQVDEELESELQQMERRALGAIDPNASDAAAGPLTADVAQVCPACFAIVFELWCMQSRSKMIRPDGEEASPFRGGADNPDGSKKKVETTLKTKRKDDKRFVSNAQARRASRCTSSLWSDRTSS